MVVGGCDEMVRKKTVDITTGLAQSRNNDLFYIIYTEREKHLSLEVCWSTL